MFISIINRKVTEISKITIWSYFAFFFFLFFVLRTIHLYRKGSIEDEDQGHQSVSNM